MKTRLVPALLIFLFAFPIFSHFLHWGDHLYHIDIANHIWRRQSMAPHPLFHACLLFLSAGENHLASYGVLAFLLAAALGVRTWLTADLIAAEGVTSVFAVTALCLALALALPLPNWWQGEAYIGNVTPNIWHNPTGVFAMPFALATFVLGMRIIERPSLGRAAGTGLFLALSLLAKPNYLLAFGPYFGLALVLELFREIRRGQFGSSAALGILALTLGPGAIALSAQYLWLRQDATVLFLPLELWKHLTREHIVGSIAIGIVYPVAVVVCYPREANACPWLIAAWATLAVGVGTYALFVEWGERLTHGNFAWGMIYADQVLFVVSTTFLLRQRGRIRQALCFAVLGLHALAGVHYLVDAWRF